MVDDAIMHNITHCFNNQKQNNITKHEKGMPVCFQLSLWWVHLTHTHTHTPVRSPGTRYFFLSKSAILAPVTFSTMTCGGNGFYQRVAWWDGRARPRICGPLLHTPWTTGIKVCVTHRDAVWMFFSDLGCLSLSDIYKDRKRSHTRAHRQR